jgi:hypothetical protein
MDAGVDTLEALVLGGQNAVQLCDKGQEFLTVLFDRD